jgi:hypothetical protein
MFHRFCSAITNRPPFQTELAINTNLVVSDTHAMVSDLHRNVLTVQGGTDSQHCSVSVTSYLLTTKHSPALELNPGQ